MSLFSSQNLLGRRPELAAPLPKAEALAEAKAWLRGLTSGEITAEMARLSRGPIVRRRVEAAPELLHPYEHPSFWAGFILIGDPD